MSYTVQVFNAHAVEPTPGSGRRVASAQEIAEAMQSWLNAVSDEGRLDFQTGYEYPFNAGYFMVIFRDPSVKDMVLGESAPKVTSPPITDVADQVKRWRHAEYSRRG